MDNKTIEGYLHSKDVGGRHLPESKVKANLVKKVGDNDYIVELSDGTRCHALLNPFCGGWFIDDKYGLVKEDK